MAEALDIVWYDLDDDSAVPAVVTKVKLDTKVNLIALFGGSNEVKTDVPRRDKGSPDPLGHTWRPQ